VRDLESGSFAYRGPFRVSDTPFTLEFADTFNSTRFISRDGVRDDKLTVELNAKFGHRRSFAGDSGLQFDVARWLREVHASEQPKKLEVELTAHDLYYNTLTRPGIGANLSEAAHSIRQLISPLPGLTRFRLTLEEIKAEP
jgi:hypothetical protein